MGWGERGVQEGEPGGAVCGVEERAGEGEEVEDLLAFAEGFDLDGAIGDGGGFEGFDDVEEVGAGADEDRDGGGWGCGFDEGADFLSVCLRLACSSRRACLRSSCSS